MQYNLPTKFRARGFSLIEMLTVIAVIGVISAIALPSVSDVNGSAKTARNQRNAQNFCAMVNSAQVSGVTFNSDSTEGILNELIEGRTGPTNGMTFQFSPLDDEAKEGLMTYCYFNNTTGQMTYSSEPIEQAAITPEPEPEPDPTPDPQGEWVNFQPINNHMVAGRISELQVHFPDRQWRWIPLDHANSMIQFRE